MPRRMHSQEFSHPFLDPDTKSFRLLEIINETSSSRRKGQTKAIVSKLRTFASPSSSRTPRYGALSYTWGCPFPKDEDLSGVKDWESNTRYILCNDEPVHIGQNLYDALQELVRRGRFGFYWIDSMCINQHDVLERNTQVAIMGSIFQNASEVICWLGRADRHLGEVVELHRRMVLVEERFGGIKEATSSPEEIDRACETSGIGTKGHRATASLSASCEIFWRRRWFGRLWVAQEVALAKQLTVLCGEKRFRWQDMVLVAQHARKASANITWTIYFNSDSPHISGSRIRRFERIRKHQERDMSKSSLLYNAELRRNQVRNAFLLEVLSMTSHLRATDPRDKIFGVLGLVLRALTDKQSPIRPIHVDYGLSTCDLYTRFATALIIDLPYLSLIGCDTPYSGARDANLPSWVPDFDQQGFYSHKIALNRYKAGILLGRQSLREVNHKTLKVSGHLLDTISSTCSREFCIHQLRFSLTTRKRSRRQPNIIDSFCRTKIFDSDKSKHLTTRDKNLFQAFLLVEISTLAAGGEHTLLQSLKSDLEAVRHKSNGTLPAQGTIDTWTMPDLRTQANEVEMLKADRLAGKFEAVAWNHVLAITESGLLAGTGHNAHVGDQIWIIRDAQTPVILRPIPDSTKFTLVGEAYVDGVMFGEALRAPDHPQPVKVEIV